MDCLLFRLNFFLSSIGSLGKSGIDDTVENVNVKSCSFNGTQNGARIKNQQVRFFVCFGFNASKIFEILNPLEEL